MRIILTFLTLSIFLFSCKKEEQPSGPSSLDGYLFETINQSGNYRIDSIKTILSNGIEGSLVTHLDESYINISFEQDTLEVFIDCCEFFYIDTLISQLYLHGTNDRFGLDFSDNHDSGILDLSPDGVFNSPPENPRIVVYTYDNLSLEIGEYFHIENDSILIESIPAEFIEMWFFTPLN